MTSDILAPYQTADLAFTRGSPYGTVAEATYAGALSFMRRRYTKDVAGADVAVVGIPYDLAVSNRPGARFGPRAIRAASSQLAWGRPWGWDFDPFERLHVVDYGDCAFDPGNPLHILQCADDIDRQFCHNRRHPGEVVNDRDQELP